MNFVLILRFNQSTQVTLLLKILFLYSGYLIVSMYKKGEIEQDNKVWIYLLESLWKESSENSSSSLLLMESLFLYLMSFMIHDTSNTLTT